MAKGHWSGVMFLTREGIRYSRKAIHKSAKTYQSKRKIWTFCIFKLLIWRQKNGPPAFGNSHFDRCRHSPGKKIVTYNKISCCSSSNQTQNSRVKHQKRAKQRKCCLYFWEKDYYRVVPVVQLGLTAARTASSVFLSIKQLIFSQIFFSIFGSGGITKHLMAGPSGNSEFCFIVGILGPVIKCLLTPRNTIVF